MHTRTHALHGHTHTLTHTQTYYPNPQKTDSHAHTHTHPHRHAYIHKQKTDSDSHTKAHTPFFTTFILYLWQQSCFSDENANYSERRKACRRHDTKRGMSLIAVTTGYWGTQPHVTGWATSCCDYGLLRQPSPVSLAERHLAISLACCCEPPAAPPPPPPPPHVPAPTCRTKHLRAV